MVRYLGKSLELVDIGKMKVPMEMWIVVLLVFHAAAQSHSQTAETAHGQHIMAEMIATRTVTAGIVAPWTVGTHPQA